MHKQDGSAVRAGRPKLVSTDHAATQDPFAKPRFLAILFCQGGKDPFLRVPVPGELRDELRLFKVWTAFSERGVVVGMLQYQGGN